MSKKRMLLIKKPLVFLVIAIFLLVSLYWLRSYKMNLVNKTCSDPEVGISLVLPSEWSCHMSEQDGFYIQPPWVESTPNTGPSPRYSIWFKLKPDYSKQKVNPKFCIINEYSSESSQCPKIDYYSHNGFEIKELVNQKRPEYGVTTSYIGVYKDFLEIELNPSSSDFELNNEDIKNLNAIFDSIKNI